MNHPAITSGDWMLLSTAVAASALTSCLIVATQHWHGRLTLDTDLKGAQKFHEHPVPRIGGLALVLGLLMSAALAMQSQVAVGTGLVALQLLLCGMPAFLAGMQEDMTKAVSVARRLAATFVSAALAVWVLDARLVDVDTVGLDQLMRWAPLAMAFTCFAVAGFANAVNIIDGFNGLAGGAVTLMFAGIGLLAWQTDDLMVMQLCIIGGASTLGFLLINYPHGRLFLGDGGAYLAGFWLAECAVLLLARNPEVSTWTVLLVCIYPVYETLFSIWRKSVYRHTGAGRPDKLHFHMLVYRRLITPVTGRSAPGWIKHGLTSLFIWALVLGCGAIAVVTQTTTMGPMGAAAGVATFALVYNHLYRALVKGCMPRGGGAGRHRTGRDGRAISTMRQGILGARR